MSLLPPHAAKLQKNNNNSFQIPSLIFGTNLSSNSSAFSLIQGDRVGTFECTYRSWRNHESLNWREKWDRGPHGLSLCRLMKQSGLKHSQLSVCQIRWKFAENLQNLFKCFLRKLIENSNIFLEINLFFNIQWILIHTTRLNQSTAWRLDYQKSPSTMP